MMKRIALILGVVLLIGATYWYLNRGESSASSYRFVSIDRGDLESVVSSTGTLDAVTTVEVGTQVSGIVSEIFVDFNDKVEDGQILAVLDTTLLQIAVREAESNSERNQAQLRHAEREYDRLRSLYEKDVLAEVELNQALYELETVRADVKVSQSKLETARQALAYATISSPISGTVIERDVDVGQTVAASLSSPRLFLIANDLSRMRILASVDESDIGLIKEGQTARFTVQAFPDDLFTGTVRQVRLQSKTEENVVTYTVIVDVMNDDGPLLPGMTATVDFLIETATDVLKVPNAALRFRPTAEMLGKLREGRERDQNKQSSPSEIKLAGFQPTHPPAEDTGLANLNRSDADQRPEDLTRLFYIDSEGSLATTPVRTGITDGQYTEIHGFNLEKGMQVIAGVRTDSGSSSSNPFQGQQGQRRGPPGPGF